MCSVDNFPGGLRYAYGWHQNFVPLQQVRLYENRASSSHVSELATDNGRQRQVLFRRLTCIQGYDVSRIYRFGDCFLTNIKEYRLQLRKSHLGNFHFCDHTQNTKFQKVVKSVFRSGVFSANLNQYQILHLLSQNTLNYFKVPAIENAVSKIQITVIIVFDCRG